MAEMSFSLKKSRCVEVSKQCISGHLHVFYASAAAKSGIDRVIISSPDTDILFVLMHAFCA